MLLMSIGAVAAQTPNGLHPERADAYSTEHQGEALLIWQQGERIHEAYPGDAQANTPHALASISKTLTTLAVLAAVDDGLIELDTPLAESVVPEWNDGTDRARITMRQVLNLTAGFTPRWGADALSFEEAMEVELVHEPGASVRYSSTPFQVAGAVLQRVLSSESPEDYLHRRVLKPIGISTVTWERVSDTNDAHLGGGASMTAPDLLRVGQLLLHNGTHNDTQVIDGDVMRALTESTETNPAYGLGVWMNAAVDMESPLLMHLPPAVAVPDGADGLIYNDGPRDLYMAAGLGHQRLYVVPSHEAVVVRFGRMGRPWHDGAFLARLLHDTEHAPSAEQEHRLRAHQWRAVLTPQLDLTEQQQRTLLPLLVERARAWSNLRAVWNVRERTPERRHDLREAQQALQQAESAIEAELTDEQADAYREWKRDQMRPQRGPIIRDPAPDS